MSDAITYGRIIRDYLVCALCSNYYDFPAEIDLRGASSTGRLFIGSLQTALSTHCLKNIDIVINMSGYSYECERPVYHITMEDADITQSTQDDYLVKFYDGIHIIRRAHKSGMSVLVHCMAGINRSATLIALYLITCGVQDAVARLQVANTKRRKPLLTNKSFRWLIQSAQKQMLKV
jgi:hypothetical protein